MKLVVVGANHAGTAAIRTALTSHKDWDVEVYDSNDNISFLGCGMALWIGEQIDGSDGLFYSNKEELESMGAKVFMKSEVTALDRKAKELTVKLEDGSEKKVHYDKLILATGSLPIIPRVPGSDLENVQQVKRFQDAQVVIDKLANPGIEKVAVVGAGYIGVELAEAFERKGKTVELIDLADICLSTYYDHPFCEKMKENLESHGIRTHFGEAVEEILGTDGKVSGIRTSKGTYDCDMVILCIGFRPNTALAKDELECLPNGAYLVDRHQRTSDENIYAIGDCASIYDNATGKDSYIALATNAVRSGILGAHNACGTPLESIGVQGSNGICIYDLKMVSTGLSYERAQKLGIPVEMTEFTDTQKPGFIKTDNPEVTVRIVYRKDDRRVIGAQMASTWDMSMGIHMFSLAIQEGITIDKLALTDLFFLPHFNQPYNYITMAALSAK